MDAICCIPLQIIAIRGRLVRRKSYHRIVLASILHALRSLKYRRVRLQVNHRMESSNPRALRSHWIRVGIEKRQNIVSVVGNRRTTKANFEIWRLRGEQRSMC